MKKEFIGVLLLVNCLLSGQSESLKTEIERIVLFDTEISYDDIPGFVVGVVDADSVYLMTFGSVAGRKDSMLTGNDIFEIGSITKSFTASLIKLLIYNDNILSESDHVNDFLDEKYRNPRMNWLTVGDLINHTSGLPKRPIGFGLKEVDVQNPYLNYTKEDLLNFFAFYVPNSEPGFEYSHTNYALLEIIIEKVTSKSYEDNITDRIFRPLEMNHSMVDFYEKRKNVLTPGLDRSGEKVMPWFFRSFEASEAIKSTGYDLVAYMRSLLDIDQKVEGLKLSEIPKNGTLSFNENIMVHEGWQLLRLNKKNTVHISTGSTSGYSAFMGLKQNTRTGVIVLSNSAFGTGDLGLLILRMINYNWKRKPTLKNGQ